MKVAVLITCHNRKQTTVRCVLTVVDMVAGDSVYLVDDGSTDGTADAVRELGLGVKIIEGNGNLYWAKGMNLAWKTAVQTGVDYDFYLWLNDDVKLKREALDGLIADWRSTNDPRSVIVGPCSFDITEDRSTYSATTSKDVQIFPNGRNVQRADGWFNGNVVLVPRAAYESVGIISDEYSHGRADYDYAERLKAAGIPCYCSSKFAGVCENDFEKKRAKLSRWQRFAMLWKPGYLNLADLWRFKRRYYGTGKAIVSSLYAIVVAIRG